MKKLLVVSLLSCLSVGCAQTVIPTVVFADGVKVCAQFGGLETVGNVMVYSETISYSAACIDHTYIYRSIKK